jgi:hypothetical protein
VEVYTSLAVGLFNEWPSRSKGRKKFCDREGPLNLQISVSNTAAQTIGAFFDEDLPGNMNHLELATMEEFKPF